MKTTPGREAISEFRMSEEFSMVYAQIIYLLQSFGNLPLAPQDLMGDCEIKIVEDSITKTVYRGYISLISLRNTGFERVEFSLINLWDRHWWKAKNSEVALPSDTMIMFGWDGTTDFGCLTVKMFGCRLFRRNSGPFFEDVDLQPKNWATPFLWGGEVPSFMVSDEVVSVMLENGLGADFGFRDGAFAVTEMQ